MEFDGMSAPLDNLEQIKAVDKEAMLDLELKFPENSKDAIKRAEYLVIPKKVKVSDKLTIKYRKPESSFLTLKPQ